MLTDATTRSVQQLAQGEETSRPPDRRVRPVVWWASIGIVCIALQAFVYVTWVACGDARPIAPAGAVPTLTKVWAWTFQALISTAAVVLVVHHVRASRKLGRPTFEAMMATGFVLCAWQDSIVNYFRPTFVYNSYLLNLGGWSAHIPGWNSPNGRLIATPLLFTIPMYVVWFWLYSVMFCALAAILKRRRPAIGSVGIFLSGSAVMILLDLLLECTFIHTHLFAYPGSIRSLSLWPGNSYQFPVYEALIGGLWFAVPAMVRYHYVARGRDVSALERGLDRVRTTQRAKRWILVAAFVGFANVTMVGYDMAYDWVAQYQDSWPQLPPYLQNGICGGAHNAPCPSRHGAIPVRGGTFA